MEGQTYQFEDARVEALKKKHGQIKGIVVYGEGGEEIRGVFKKPDLKVISAASKFAQEDPVKAGLTLFENCWIEGDERMKTDDELKMGAINQLGKLFQVRQGEIKNL